MMNERILFLDIARGLCIILVVIGHYMPDYSPAWYAALHDVIYRFHMPLFMFVSGCVYVATLRSQSYWKFLSRKVHRLMLPYITTSLIVVTIKLGTQHLAYVEKPVGLLSYAKIFCLPEAGYFLWFIWALWWMFVIIPLFNTPKKRLGLFLASVIIHFLPLSFGGLFCLNEAKTMLVWFMLGVVMFDHQVLRQWMSSLRLERLPLAVGAFAVTLIMGGVN